MQSRSCSKQAECKCTHFAPKCTTYIVLHSLHLCSQTTSVSDVMPSTYMPTWFIFIVPPSCRFLPTSVGLSLSLPFLSISFPSHSDRSSAARIPNNDLCIADATCCCCQFSEGLIVDNFVIHLLHAVIYPYPYPLSVSSLSTLPRSLSAFFCQLFVQGSSQKNIDVSVICFLS